MLPLREEVKALSDKIELLYLMMEELNHRFSSSVIASSSPELSPHSHDFSQKNLEFHSPQMTYSHLDPSQEYQEFILHEEEWKPNLFNRSEPESKKDVQIQRLTAQLTAAYNRIAALEEQLLAQRIHS